MTNENFEKAICPNEIRRPLSVKARTDRKNKFLQEIIDELREESPELYEMICRGSENQACPTQVVEIEKPSESLGERDSDASHNNTEMQSRPVGCFPLCSTLFRTRVATVNKHASSETYSTKTCAL